MTTTDSAHLVHALEELGRALGRVRLPLELPGVATQRAARQEMLGQLEDYVLPRLRQIEAPLLAVVGGSTGAGKSTLVNSVVGATGDRAGRAAADDAVAGAGVQPGRRRLVRRRPDPSRAGPDHRRVRRPAARCSWCRSTPCPPGLAILDAPDIDSVEVRNRDARHPAPGRRRPVAVRDLRRPLRRPGAVGLPQGGRRAERRGRRSCSTGSRRAPARRSPSTCARCSPSAASAARRCSR